MSIQVMSPMRDERPTTRSTQARTWCDEELAPALDLGLLQALVRHELPLAQARDVYRLIHSFASWDAAHTEALLAEQRRVPRN